MQSHRLARLPADDRGTAALNKAISDAQITAIARPGESWASARQRAKRLYLSVRICRPCPECDAEAFAHLGIETGWIDEDDQRCPCCSYLSDSLIYLDQADLASHSSDFGIDSSPDDLPVVIQDHRLVFGIEWDQVPDSGVLNVLLERVFPTDCMPGNVEFSADELEAFRAD